MVDGYVMKAQKVSAPNETVYWAVINAPDYTASLSEYDPADLSLPATIDYTFETAVDGVAGAPAGFAGGDLNGQYPNPKVIKINGRPVADISPDDGYVLTWKNSRWEPRQQNAPEFLNPNRVLTSSAFGKISADIPLPGLSKPFSVFMEKPIGAMSFDRITQDMVDPGFSVEVRHLNYEVGQIVTDPSFSVSYGPSTSANITYNRASIQSMNLTRGSSTPTFLNSAGTIITDINGLSSFKVQGTFSGAPGYVDYILFNLAANDGIKSENKQLKINWFFKFYYGIGPDWSTFTDNSQKANFITNTSLSGTMTGILTNETSRTISATCSSDNDYIYYVYPASYGNVTFSFNGILGGFEKIDTVNVTNVHDSSISTLYSVWKSVNPGLGYGFGPITLKIT